MRLSDLLSATSSPATNAVEAKRPAPVAPSAQNSGGASFDSFLAERSRDNGRQNEAAAPRIGNDRPAQADRPSRADQTTRTDRHENVVTDRVVQEVPQGDNVVSQVVQATAMAYTDAEGVDGLILTGQSVDELLAELAAMFGLSHQELMGILAQMGVDPGDGLLVDHLPKLAQALMGLDNPAQLLWHPEAPVVLDKINTLVAEYVQGDTAKVPVSADAALLAENALAEGNVLAEYGEMGEELVKESAKASDAIVQNDAPERTVRERADAEPVKAAAVVQDQEGEVLKRVVSAEESLAQQRDAAKDTQPEARTDSNVVNVNSNVVSDAQLAEVRSTIVQAQTTTSTVEVVKQLVDQMKVHVNPETTELRLILKPESLGEVMLRVVAQNGIVSAQLYAESQRIKEAIEANMAQLRNALAEKGIEVSELSAFVAGENGDEENAFEQERDLASARINSIMGRNGMTDGEIADEGNEIEIGDDESSDNPLEVNYRV